MNARPLLILAFAVPVVAFVLALWVAPPILNTDSATGFLAWESMSAGGPWNSIATPDPADIARDQAEFVTWWSPGQYVFPGMVHSLGLNWCLAALVTTLASVLLGCAGVWLLAKSLCLSPAQGALACLLTTVACGALHDFGMFRGGNVLLFAATPFLYLALLRVLERPRPLAFACFSLVCLLALFCKHAAIIAIAGALLFAASELLIAKGIKFATDSRLWFSGVGALLAVIVARLLWAHGGPTPGDAGQVPVHPLAAIAFSLNGPWFSLTGAGSLVSWLFQRAGLDADQAWNQHALWLLPGGVAATAIILLLGLRRDSTRVWRLAACTWVATTGLLLFLFLRGASVSFDERHFLPAAIPLALAVASSALPAADNSRARFAFLAITIGALTLGVVAHAQRVRLLAKLPRSVVSGFSQPDLSPKTRAAILRELPPGALLVLPNPVIALDFPGRRLLVTDAMFADAGEIARWRFVGSPPLVLAVPASLDADGRGNLLRADFVGISSSHWRMSPVGDWHLWHPETSPRPAVP